MSDLSNVKSCVVVVAMPGCPACHDYLPRFHAQVKRFLDVGQPFVYYENGHPINRGQIPVLVLDATSADGEIQAFADAHGITGMPTTVLLTQRARPVKLEGAIDDDELYNLLVSACYANR